MKEDIDQLFRISCDNLKWFEENYETLKKEYDKKWIVIQNKQIVASGNSFESIVNAMKKHDPKTALVEYVQSEQVAMFF